MRRRIKSIKESRRRYLPEQMGPTGERFSCATCKHWKALLSSRWLEPDICSDCFLDPEHPNWEANDETA